MGESTGVHDGPSASAIDLRDDDVPAALAALAIRLRGRQAIAGQFARLTGGASMQTWAFTVTSEAGVEPLILRRRTPATHTSAAAGVAPVDLNTEAVLMRAALAQGAPVPAVVHVCDLADGLGEAHVTRRVDGETLGRRIVRDHRFKSIRGDLARQCGDVIARVHASQVSTSLRFEDAQVTLDRYEDSYRAISSPRPVIELAMRYLRDRVPDPVAATVVHGDFRNGNMIIDPDLGVVALLDWELAHSGDPAEDLGYICVNSWRYGAVELPVGGFGSYEDLREGYRSAGGGDISMERIKYWQAMGSLKWAIICMELFASWTSGIDRSVERAMIGRRVSEAEIDLLALIGAMP